MIIFTSYSFIQTTSPTPFSPRCGQMKRLTAFRSILHGRSIKSRLQTGLKNYGEIIMFIYKIKAVLFMAFLSLCGIAAANGRRTPPPGADPPRQYRTPSDDRRAERRRDRAEHCARGGLARIGARTGKDHFDLCAVSQLARYPELASGLFDEACDHRQPKASPLAVGLGGEERFRDAFQQFRGDPAAIVPHANSQ